MLKVLSPIARRWLLASALCGFSLCSSANADTPWNRFRGENGSGVASESAAPLPWTDADVAWKVTLPGKGNGSPIIQGNKVFIMSADASTADRYVLAFDLDTGKELWRKSYASTPYKMHTRSSYASCTPCADDKAVYVTWGSPDGVIVRALTHAGDELWTRDLGRYVGQHGYGASPMLYKNTVIILNSQDAQELPAGVEPGKTAIVALDITSGKTVWETSATTTRTCYSVPALYHDSQNRDVLVVNETGDGFMGLDANTGSPLWNRKAFTKRCVSSPLVIGDLIFGTEGSGGGGNIVFAINAGRSNELAYDIRGAVAPYVPTPVAKDDTLFLWSDTGIVSAVDLATGKSIWSKRIGGNVSSSPIIVGDKLIGIAEDGTVTVLSASREFKNLGEVKLNETTRSTPAVDAKHFLIRTDSTLYCVGKSSK